MKKFITTMMLLAFVTLNSNANTVTTLLDKTSNLVDSTKKTVKESITTVDTSSNFKMVYQDVKEGLTGLAKGLKVGVEHVYIVLVKQQVVHAITWLIVLTILSLLTFYFWYNFNTNYKKTQDKDHDWYHDDLDDHFDLVGNLIIFVVLFAITLILFFTSIHTIISGFVNPEYGAIKDIINFVSNTSETCSTCN